MNLFKILTMKLYGCSTLEFRASQLISIFACYVILKDSWSHLSADVF